MSETELIKRRVAKIRGGGTFPPGTPIRLESGKEDIILVAVKGDGAFDYYYRTLDGNYLIEDEFELI